MDSTAVAPADVQPPPKRTILLVEDNPDDRAEIRRLFREHRDQYTLVEEVTGAAGLERCRTDRPDCVLLDYYLPDMDGGQFLAMLKAAGEDGVAVPIAMLTGNEEQDAAIAALKGGAQDYLVKGTVTGKGLVRAIDNAIEKFNIQRELEEKRSALELRTWQLETVRKELQSKLLELADAHQAKEQFLAVMSHEMRTPLNAILGYADLMDLGIGGEEARQMQIDRIRVGGRHLLDLINDVLDLARADAEKLEMDLRPVDLGGVLDEVSALLESQADGKGITLNVQACGAELPHVRADLRRLRQVLTNLVGNAIKFTDEGSVAVRCEPAGDGMVHIRVTDTGIGIDAEVLPLVFSEFYQAAGDLTREKGGSGLGLTISQRFARLMGGEITAESTLGRGSVFTLALPFAEPGSQLRPEDVQGRSVGRQERLAAPLRSETEASAAVVAFCDDEEALEALAEHVAPRVRLVWTTDAEAVPELVRREQASLVVMDIACAGGAAWRVAHTLYDAPDFSQVAVLLLPTIPASATSNEEGGLDLGWVSLVPKPFTREQLTHAVSTATRNQQDTNRAGAEGASPQVLVVDDDPDSRRVAASFLSQAGARIREAADGESALAAMRREPPGVVVLDLMMPVLDGFGVIAAMQADPRLAGIPVVVLSAKSLTDAERQFLARTAIRVLQKGEHRLTDVAALVLRASTGAASSGSGP